MKRAVVLLSIGLMALPPDAGARYGGEDPRLERLFRTFISPCCWREELTIHDSPLAEELRAQIRSMVRDGRSDEEIKATLVSEHTKRILTLPEGAPRTLLFWSPWVMLGLGMGGLVYLLRRMLRRAPLLASSAGPLPVFDEGDDLL